jgi:predicted polyphosphate/ATP-dependent NAD kinase
VEFGVDLILFCGGDGTARDIASVVGTRVPILGIPSGVKMYSGVFGVTPARTAEILIGFLKNELALVEAEVLDPTRRNESREWAVRYFYNGPIRPTLRRFRSRSSRGLGRRVEADIASDVGEEIAANPQVLFILGAGSTLQAVGAEIGVGKKLLGIDAVLDSRLVGQDLNERSLLALLEKHPDCRLVLSPIGAQGFVLGRGNLQLSPEAIRRIGIANILVLATPSKLARRRTEARYGDASLDAELAKPGFLPVVIGTVGDGW